MMLDKIIVLCNKKLVRLIQCKSGLNIITDDLQSRVTSNNIGKSTFLKIVEFLFMGSPKNIYFEHEYDTASADLYEWFQTNNVEVYAAYKTDSKTITLRRNICVDEDFYYFINNKPVTDKLYEEFIKENFFKIKSDRPSLARLRPFFFRTTMQRMINTFNILGDYARTSDYTEVFLFLMGFKDTNLMDIYRKLNLRLTTVTKNARKVGSIIRDTKAKSEVKKLKKELSGIQKDLFEDDGNSYEDIIAELNTSIKYVNEKTDKLLRYKLQVQSINEALENKEKVEYVNELEIIYQHAKIDLNIVKKKYEDVLSFHNQLILNKHDSLEKELPTLNKNIDKLQKIIDINQEKIKTLYQQLRTKAPREKIIAKVDEIGNYQKKIGMHEGFIVRQNLYNNEKIEIEEKAKKCKEEIAKYLKTIRETENRLRTQLALVSKQIYDNSSIFYFNYNNDQFACDPIIEQDDINPQGGKKKAEIVLFDLCLRKVTNEMGLDTPLFIFHDYLEDIDNNQVNDLFSFSNTLSNQHFVATLSSKFDYKRFEESIILKLNDQEKFFKV